jgi:hypothetical protein
MPILRNELDLDRCPHCGVARPSIPVQQQFETKDYAGANMRRWRVYCCRTCGGLILAASISWDGPVLEQYPRSPEVSSEIPDRAREYLRQAMDSLSAPAGAVMLAASAVDAMLKAKGLSAGSLYSRIDEAATNHLITADMARWAHQVRLDANDQRHSDSVASLPTIQDANRVVDFAQALAQFMFVLPALVTRGITASGAPP